MKQGKDKSYALRIDARLVEPLQKLKKLNRRSLNAEINAALEQWVGGSTKPGGKQAKGAPKASAEPAPSVDQDEPARVGKPRKPKQEALAGPKGKAGQLSSE